MNVHAWVVFLLFESFLTLFNVQNVQKKLKSQNWSSTNSARLLELLCRNQSQSVWLPTNGSQPGGTSCSAWCLYVQSRLNVNIALQLQHCWTLPSRHCCQLLSPSSIGSKIFPATPWWMPVSALHRPKKLWQCSHAARLSGLQTPEKNSSTIFWSNSWCLMRFRAAGVSSAIRVPAKTIPVAPVASQSLQVKTLSQLESSAAAFFWVNFDWFIAVLWTVSKKHGPKGPKGQSLRLPYPIWLLGPGSVKKDAWCCMQPGLTCCMHFVSKPFWFGKHVRTRRFLRNACNVSEPLAASRFRCGSKYVSNYNDITCVYYFKNGTVSETILYVIQYVSYHDTICLHSYVLSIANIFANWPEFLRNCPAQFPHSWVENCRETGRIWAISMVRDVISPGLIITRNASTMLDVRYQHRSSPKISGVFPNSKISKFQTISSKFSCKGLAVRLSQANHQIGKIKKT